MSSIPAERTSSGDPEPPAGRPRSWLDRFLGIFTDVRSGEATTALLLMLNVFLLLAGYYLLKTIREPLILAVEESGPEYKAYSNAAIALLLIGLVPAYSAFASRASRVKLINGVTAFFIACLLGFFVWTQIVGVPSSADADAAAIAAAAATQQGRLWLGIAFFIWVGIFNVMVIAQFWAFANDVYTVEQGKRLFAVVMLGASLGAIFGSYATEPLIKAYGIYPLMLIAGGMLVLCMVLTNIVNRRERRRREGERRTAGDRAAAAGAPAAPESEDPKDAHIAGKGGFSLVLADKYLLFIALLMMVLNLVNTTGEYILGERVAEFARQKVGVGPGGTPDEAAIGAWIGSFYGNYFFWVNVGAAVLQAFFVSRVIKFIGIRGALLIVPLISLAGYLTLAFAPILGLIRIVKTTENALDYSLQNTTRHSLFLPTSREAKYKAKQATDTFFWRFGDLLSAGLVFAGVTWLGFATPQFAMTNAALVLIWLGIAFFLGREFHRRARTA